jgi:hypothetical protein
LHHVTEIFTPFLISEAYINQVRIRARTEDAIVGLGLDVGRLVNQGCRVFVVSFALLVEVQDSAQCVLSCLILNEATSFEQIT